MPHGTAAPQIESTRLMLKPFTASDAAQVFPCITQTLTRFMSWEPPASPAEFERVWQGWLPTIADGSDYVFVIRLQGDGDFLGLAGLHDAKAKTPELGIWIREDRHGQGYGGEAVAALAKWASQVLVAEAFIYPVAEQNHASRRIAEALGGLWEERRSNAKYESVVYRIPAQP